MCNTVYLLFEMTEFRRPDLSQTAYTADSTHDSDGAALQVYRHCIGYVHANNSAPRFTGMAVY